MTRKPDYEHTLGSQLEYLGCMPPVFEHRFAHPRRWRFDLAYVQARIGIEIEGGTWIAGRHVRPRGYQADLCKYNAAVALGWLVLRFTPAQVKSWEAAQQVASVLLGREVRLG